MSDKQEISGDRKSSRGTAMFIFLSGLFRRHGLCQECETLKNFLDSHEHALNDYQYQNVFIFFREKIDFKYKSDIKPLIRRGKHEMPCMSVNMNSLVRVSGWNGLKRITQKLDDAEKGFSELKVKINKDTANKITVKTMLDDAIKIRKQVWLAFSDLSFLLEKCDRLANIWERQSEFFELPASGSEAKLQVDSKTENEVLIQIYDNLDKYNNYSKKMISKLQDYLMLLLLGQKSKLLRDENGYYPQKYGSYSTGYNFNFKYSNRELGLPRIKDEIKFCLFLLPRGMDKDVFKQLTNQILDELFEIPGIVESIPPIRPLKLRSMLSANYLEVYGYDAIASNDELEELNRYNKNINLFCTEGAMLHEDFEKNNMGIKLDCNNDFLLVFNANKKETKFLNRWKEQGKLGRYITLPKTDDENLFSKIIKLTDPQYDICPTTSIFNSARYGSCGLLKVLLDLAYFTYYGVFDYNSGNFKTEHEIIKNVYQHCYEVYKKDLIDILNFTRVVEFLISRSGEKIEIEDIPSHFLRPSIPKTGKRLATSWFVQEDGHNTRNAAVVMVLGKAVVDFIKKETSTDKKSIIKQIRNTDDRLRRLEDSVLKINPSNYKKTGKKNERFISHEKRVQIPKEALKKALLGKSKR